MQSAPRHSHGQILPIQVLRGLAALSIALLHIQQSAGIFFGTQGIAPYAWMRAVPWEAGVDVFFVISGFVIVYASADLFGQSSATGVFLIRRLARVVPLYWLVTTLTVLIALGAPGALHDPLGGSDAYVVASYAFIPWPLPNGTMEPVFRLGWTLNYEMLFYVIVAAFLASRRRTATVLVVGTVLTLAAVGLVLHPKQPQLAYWTNPIVIEFAFGVLLATLRLRGIRIGRWPQIVLLVAGAVALGIDGTAYGVGRAVSFGVPAAAIVAAASLRDVNLSSRAALLARRMGDASYALYLTHLFPMRAVRDVWAHLHMAEHFGAAAVLSYVLVSVVLAVALALAVNRLFEKPALRSVMGAFRAA